MQPYQPMGPGAGPGPGQPGPYPYPYPYPPTQPAGPRTLGTLSIVFGAICAAQSFLGVVAGGGLASLMMRMFPRNVGLDAMEHYLDTIRTPQMLQSLAFLLMSLWLLAIGVGQRRYRAWAARQSVIWGVLALVVLVGITVMHFTVIGPAGTRMLEEISHHSHMRNPMSSFMGFAGFMGLLFYAPYPIILLVTFRKPSTISAMNT